MFGPSLVALLHFPLLFFLFPLLPIPSVVICRSWRILNCVPVYPLSAKAKFPAIIRPNRKAVLPLVISGRRFIIPRVLQDGMC